MTTPGYYAVGQTGGYSQSSDSIGACFCAGTLVMTPSGEDRIEDLTVGDHILTASGASRPVIAIGLRSYPERQLAATPALRPIRVGAGALGEQLPRRDLLVSREQSLLVDGVLVPAFHLSNGMTITAEGHARRVYYVHLQVAGHDLLIAEGVAAEATGEEQPACAPKVEFGYALEAIRCRLAGLAGEIVAAA